MIAQLKLLGLVLATAKFKDADVKAKADNLIEQMDAELTEEGYEPGTAVEEAANDLQEALNQSDESVENARATQKPENGFDPFEGLGEDEDTK